MAGFQVEEQIETNGEGITNNFNLDHIITNLGLRISIDHFSINIRSKITRAFIDKGLGVTEASSSHG